MTDPRQSEPNSALDHTLIVPAFAVPLGDEVRSRDAAEAGEDGDSAVTTRARVALVRGEQPQLAAETKTLLQNRLRAAVIVLFLAVTTFFLRSFVVKDSPIPLFQAVVAAILGGSVILLSPPRAFTLRRLRQAELTLFGITSLFLGFYQYKLILAKAQANDAAGALGAMKSCVIYFFGVIILYGTFIPNTWRRTAIVGGLIALVPGVVPLVMRILLPHVRQVADQVATLEQVSDNVLMLTLGVITAAYGTHIIHMLRKEVFKARQLGQYRLKQKLGSGGMGEVYFAEHQLLKRPCAIKLIRAGQQTDTQALSRFEREVRTTAMLSHPNTIDVYDYGRTDDGTFYYVMEYLPGLTLADIVQRYGPLPPARVIHLLRQLCGALQEAHQVGLIHRDIKPANIFATERGGIWDVAKLLDFGLVLPLNQREAGGETGISGSPLYMSPEQADPAQTIDQRSDIYGLGATAYYLLTGEPPFRGRHLVEVLQAHAQKEVTPPSELNAEIPADLEQVILRCLRKSPPERFADAQSLQEALSHCTGATAWTNAAAADWWHSQRGS